MSTSTGRVPLLDPETDRFPDKYTPQGALDAVTAAEGARDDAEGFAADAQASAASIAKGQPNGVGSLDASGKQPESQVPARLSSQALTDMVAAMNEAPAVSFIPIGDSLTAYSGGTSIATPVQAMSPQIYDGKGIHAWLRVYMAGDMRMIGNAGIGGQTSAQIAARFDTDVLAYKPDIAAILAGTNDLPDGTNGASTIANLQGMYEKAAKAGILVLATTIPPATAAQAGQETLRLRVNQWMRGYARSHRGVILADIAAAWQDPTLTGFKVVAAYVHDGVHPSMLGAAVAARVMADALRPFVPKNRKNAAPAVAPFNLLTNPHFIGSVGTTDANTKNVGGSWMINNISQGVTVTTAARTDGLRGNYVEIVVPTGKSFTMTTNVTVDGTKLAVGDEIAFNVTVQVAGIETGAVMRSLGATVQQYNGSSFGDRAHDIYSDGSLTPASPGWYGAGAAHPDGVYGFTVPSVAVGAGRTLVQVAIGAQGGGTYRFYGAQMENLTKIAAI